MTTETLSKAGDALFESIKGLLARSLQPLVERLDAAEKRELAVIYEGVIAQEVTKAIEALPKPKDGADGKSIDRAELVDEINQIARKAVDALPKPKDGESVPVAVVAALVETEVAKAIATIPPPRDGKDGVDGADGKNGENVPIEVVSALVTGEVAKAVSNIPVPEDGREGEPGRDAFAIDVLPMIDATRHYQRGTWAKHNGGLWMARSATEGMNGWECITDGRDRVEYVQSENDPRQLTVREISSSGKVVEAVFRVPMVIDLGVYKEGQQSHQGDGVTWGRHYWIAKRDTTSPPEPGPDWRLAVRSGRDGKDGPRGEKGERGVEGRSGRDLTQMAFDGSKS